MKLITFYMKRKSENGTLLDNPFKYEGVPTSQSYQQKHIIKQERAKSSKNPEIGCENYYQTYQ